MNPYTVDNWFSLNKISLNEIFMIENMINIACCWKCYPVAALAAASNIKFSPAKVYSFSMYMYYYYYSLLFI